MGFFDQFYEEPGIEQLLKKPDLTLEELVGDDNLIQECKSRNGRVVEFLQRSTSLAKLLQWIFLDPKESPADHKNAIIANEILQCEIEDLYVAILQDEEQLTTVLAVLDRPAPLPPHVSQPLVKVLHGLVGQRGLAFSAYLTSHTFPDFWRHIETHQMSSILMQLLEVHDDQENLTLADWWFQNGLADGILATLSPDQRPEVRLNVVAFLRDVAENKDLLPVSERLLTPTFLDQLFELFLADVRRDPRSTLFRTALEFLRAAAEAWAALADAEAVLATLLANFAAHMAAVADYLTSPGDLSFDPPLPAPVNADFQHGPLGAGRLAVAEFLAVAAPHSPALQDALLQHDVLRLLAHLVFTYDCHDMLHNAFAGLVHACLGLPPLCEALLGPCQLPQRIIQANAQGQKGLFGHLTLLSNALLEAEATNEAVKAALEVCGGWKEYAQGDLQRRNTTNAFLLGGQKLALLMAQVEKRDITQFDDSDVAKAALILPQAGFSPGPREGRDDDDDEHEERMEEASSSAAANRPTSAPPGSPILAADDDPPSPTDSPIQFPTSSAFDEVDFSAAFGAASNFDVESVPTDFNSTAASSDFSAPADFDANFGVAFGGATDSFTSSATAHIPGGGSQPSADANGFGPPPDFGGGGDWAAAAAAAEVAAEEVSEPAGSLAPAAAEAAPPSSPVAEPIHETNGGGRKPHPPADEAAPSAVPAEAPVPAPAPASLTPKPPAVAPAPAPAAQPPAPRPTSAAAPRPASAAVVPKAAATPTAASSKPKAVAVPKVTPKPPPQPPKATAATPSPRPVPPTAPVVVPAPAPPPAAPSPPKPLNVDPQLAIKLLGPLGPFFKP